MNKRMNRNSVKNIVGELIQPFADLTRTSRALLGVNLAYMLEGLTYFGVVGLLAIYFNQYIGLNDIQAGWMLGFLTGGITLSQLLLGATVDWVGVRKALLFSLSAMLFGRILLSSGPGVAGTQGMWSSSHVTAMIGLLCIIIGYGIYMPASYTAVKKFTTASTAAMGYAMLYGLMNLGGFLPGLISPPLRKSFEIVGVFWAYVLVTIAEILIVMIVITKKASQKAEEAAAQGAAETESLQDRGLEDMSAKEKLLFYIKHFPLKDMRFLSFIFILIPVQTLFAHNWLTLPLYTSRAFTGFVSNNFEFFVNFNPILIFILTPMVTALTVKTNPYKMMILGTFVMASPTFVLALGPNINTLFIYLIVNTIGEAMWQPRFLQWVAEIAPKNMTGIYMGIGQFPWFLTKVITSLYSGWFLTHYCPPNTPPAQMNTELMWLIYGLIALISPVGLLIARKWMLKGFKTKYGE